MRCPCGTGETYGDCCGPLHRGERAAATAEQLMRSRFSAFAVGDTEYLLATWHRSTRPAGVDLDPAQRWTRLDVLATTGGSPFHETGTVEFRAHYRQDGKPGSMHENSAFTREGGRWLYVRGQE
ncbi:YchJ family protein [Amycolatopsis sp. GM8]|uniref:YchJ family protein n=1 Tax=Amycolatopsis sp. GM8 TaxID=2896530 RepID=UPI001F1E6EC9|nr:YchJ family protein [Amycolatopsis sp. GM8]